jgi:hypothetical protein
VALTQFRDSGYSSLETTLRKRKLYVVLPLLNELSKSQEHNQIKEATMPTSPAEVTKDVAGTKSTLLLGVEQDLLDSEIGSLCEDKGLPLKKFRIE